MSIPKPQQGQIIRYSYVWHREAIQGREEGRKDRPCVIVVATKDDRVVVVPITHTKPDAQTPALEIPAEVSKRAGLDHERSWVVANEVNVFKWPGQDIRRATPESWIFGQLPPNFTKAIIDGVQRQRGRMKTISRDDPLPKKDWGKKAEPSKPRPAPKPSKDVDRSR